MFQRLRGAIDRTIAEEQAKLKPNPDQAGHSRSPSTASRNNDGGKRAGAKAPINNASSEGVATADPAVFEAAFVIDDSDEPSRAGTPKPTVPSTDPTTEKHSDSTSTATGDEKKDSTEGKMDATPESQGGDAEAKTNSTTDGKEYTAPSQGLTPEIKQRLRKLEKLEATYPELLRSYRVAHRRATAIEPFEKALRENTPLTSIGDPTALIEYLSQLNLKGDMVMEELKRLSAERDELQKKHEETLSDLREAKATIETLEGSKDKDADTGKRQSLDNKTDDGTTARNDTTQMGIIAAPSPDLKSQKVNDEERDGKDGGDFFSYDEEYPQLQTELDSIRAELLDVKKKLTSAEENGVKLAKELERSSKESGEASASKESLQAQLDASSKDVLSLQELLKSTQAQLDEQVAKTAQEEKLHNESVQVLKDSLNTTDLRSKSLETELAKSSTAKAVSKKLIDDLSSQIETLKAENSRDRGKLDELLQKQQTEPTLATADKPSTSVQATGTPASSSSSKKKNKNKKKKNSPAVETTGQSQEPPRAETDTSEIESQMLKLREDIATKDAQIERLSKQRKTEEDLREEIESLQDDLVNIGQDHVKAKDTIKTLEAEKAALRKQIATLEEQLDSTTTDSKVVDQMRDEMRSLKQDYEDVMEENAGLQMDLGAAQQLAQSRFKDLSELRDVLQKAQPELKSLRHDSTLLKTTKEELAAKQKGLRDAEKKEKDLKRDLARAQEISSEQRVEMKTLQDKLSGEGTLRANLENDKRVAARDLRKSEAERSEFKVRAENAERDLGKATDEVNKLRPQVKELEDQVYKLNREKVAAQEEVEFKIQQYSNAQSLLSSMRDQTTEVSVQLKESQSQAESLEEELAEVQRLLQERTREGETMRRLLADVDERADSKVREMRARMEAAIEERDRVEDESNTLARRKNRETEDLKGKIRGLEQEVKSLARERDELEEREKEWRRRREELETLEQQTEDETAEMRSTVSHLRAALDASESQVRDAEKQRTELRKLLDEAKQKYERANKELKSSQAKLSSRSSMDSNPSATANGGASGGSAGELLYLKTILLQFLEQKDGKLRAQLVPVLGKLLRFDKADEAKWLTAVQHIDVR